MQNVTIRRAAPEDFDALGQVMFDAVRLGDSPYSEAQRAAWVPAPRAGEKWQGRLGRQHIWLAERAGAKAGFISLDQEKAGYIDLAFIAPDFRGRGVFGELYAALEAQAARDGLARLWVHASLMAQPAFASRGFRALRHETVSMGEERLERAEMEKRFAA